MSDIQETLKKVKSEELLSRFRSKEDLYKSILSNEKKALRQKDIVLVQVPQYEELSVKHLFQEAMQDPIVREYLPELEMNSNRLPERNFFFGILGTIKNDYLKQVIQDANMLRYSSNEEQQKDDYIVIDNRWFEELIKHPFLSKKPGKAIFLLKQRSKLIRNKKAHHKFDLSQRMSQEYNEEDEMNQFIQSTKRQKTGNTLSQSLSQANDQESQMQFQI